MSPKHYARDVNIISGRCHFDNTKLGQLYFLNEAGQQVSFNKAPFITITLSDTANSPAVRYDWLKSGSLFIGCKIKFATNFTGDVDVQIMEA